MATTVIYNRDREELRRVAKNNGVGNEYEMIEDGLEHLFAGHKNWSSNKYSRTFCELGGKQKVIFSMNPYRSNAQNGLLFLCYIERFSIYFNIDQQVINNILPPDKLLATKNVNKKSYQIYEGFFKNLGEIESFFAELNNLKAN